MATYANPLHQFDRQLPLGDLHYADHVDFLDIYSEQHHHQPHPQLMVDSHSMAPYEGQGELDFSQDAFVGDDHDFFAKQSAHVQQFQQLQQHQHQQHQHQHHQHPQPPSLTAADRFVNAYGANSSSNSAASIGSSASSAHGSPTVHPDFAQASLQTHSIWDHNLPTGLESNNLNVEDIDFDELFPDSKLNGISFVDPSLIQPVATPHSLTPPILGHQTPAPQSNIILFPQPHPYPVSPVGSSNSQRSSGNQYKSPRISFQNPGWAPYQTTRRPSSFSNASRFSSESPSSEGHGDESREKERCPFPDCGRTFKDLKAHMLTHQNERPEKCPIASCEYHHKGFARKYDKNRHTLTHYKGTMVCGFCPGSGSASEKSFNRADVFKRHLTSVHNVEQNPPNSRKKASTNAEDKSSPQSKDATGKCSTCGGFFKNAQAFYEHLDDCVLRIVQQEDPSEAINEKLLSSVSDDPEVQRTMDRHNLHNVTSSGFPAGDEEDEEEAEEEDPLNQEGGPSGGAATSRSGRGGIRSRKDDAQGNSWGPLSASAGTNVSKAGPGQTSGGRGNARCGVTFSKGGVALVGKSRKRRKNYPLSWGASADKVKMKKRVICCFDGPRRLVKDDMMLGTEFEVRMPLPGEEGRYITDLDMETLRRSEAFHASAEEERGEWYPDNVRMSAIARTASTPVLPPATP